MFGLLIAVVGSGSTRANLLAFGANQYKLPEQSKPLKLYFSLQIIALKLGQLIGQLILPVLKEEVHCFGMSDCYSLSFGTAAAAMLMAFFLLLSGRSFYVQQAHSSDGSLLVKVVKCIIVSMLASSLVS